MSQPGAIVKDARSFRRGDVVGGRYKLTGLLGRGGYGSVYAAKHTGTGQALALKVMGVDASTTEDDVVARFYREARITASLTDVHTVRVFDVGQVENGPLYMAMEMLRGPNLFVVLRRLEKASRRLSQAETIALALPILQSLTEAHAAGLVHRDLKPANIIIATMGSNHSVVKVLDFGIARTQDSELTSEGQALGTPAYMSPEQVRGREVDERADLYSLGVILYRCLAGKPPFDAEDSFALAFMHVNEDLPPLRPQCKDDVTDAMVAVIERVLAKDPKDRYQTADAMYAALQEVLAATPKPVVLPVTDAEADDAAKPPRTSPLSVLGALVAEVTDLKAETPAVVRDAFAHSEDEQTKANEDGAPAPGSETVALRARAAADAVQTAPELDDQPTAALDAAAIAASRAAARRAAEVSATDAAAGGTIAEPATGSRGKVVAAIVGLVVVAACAVAFALLGLDRETPEPIAAKAAEQTKTSPGTNSAGGDAVVKRAHALVQAAMKEPDLAKREAELMAALVLTPKDAAFQALLKATREQRKSAAAAEAAQADKAKAQAQALAIEKAAAESLSAAQAAANKLAADKSKQGASSPTGAKAPAKAKPPTPAKPARRQPPVARKPAAARKPVARKPVAPKPAALKPAKKQADDAPFMDF